VAGTQPTHGTVMSLVTENAAGLRHRTITADTVFPLPLTPFEFFFRCDARSHYEGVIYVELESRGRFDRSAFELAYLWTHARHPLLSARVAADARGWPEWISGAPGPVQYGAGPVPTVGADAPMHVQIRQAGDETKFRFGFSHMAVDGLGAFQFLGDLFIGYNHACAGHVYPPVWRRLDPERLRERDGHQTVNPRKLSELWQIAKVHLPLSLRSAALVSEDVTPPATSSTAPQEPAEFLVEHLSREETDALSRVAAGASVMLNDLLVRDYFLMLEEWNRQTSQARAPLRVMIPTNMRTRKDLRMPAANVFSYAFVTRTARDCQDPHKLLESIRHEMADIKREKRGLYYEAGLRLLSRWPAFVRWSLNRPTCFATGVFTNLSSGFDRVPLPTVDGCKVAGDLLFETGAGAGPIRPGTRISFAAHNYAGRLAISAVCDAQVFSPSQQRALLDAYLAKLRTTIAGEKS